MKKLGNLDSLRYFSAAATFLNFTKAAQSMGISQSAMSQQIGRLEKEIGFKLFNRSSRGLVLTDDGKSFWNAVREGVGRIEHSLNELTATSSHMTMSVRTLPSFATKWLLPRVSGLQEFAPELSLTVDADVILPNFLDDNIDIGILYGEADRPDWSHTFLFNDFVFPVCSPAFLEKNSMSSPADLEGSFLLHDSVPVLNYSTSWRDWFSKQNMTMPKYGSGPAFNTAALVLDGALGNMGVALTRYSLVADYLDSGSLVRLFEHIDYSDSFYFVCPKTALSRVSVQRFQEWISVEAQSFNSRINF